MPRNIPVPATAWDAHHLLGDAPMLALDRYTSLVRCFEPSRISLRFRDSHAFFGSHFRDIVGYYPDGTIEWFGWEVMPRQVRLLTRARAILPPGWEMTRRFPGTSTRLGSMMLVYRGWMVASTLESVKFLPDGGIRWGSGASMTVAEMDERARAAEDDFRARSSRRRRRRRRSGSRQSVLQSILRISRLTQPSQFPTP